MKEKVEPKIEPKVKPKAKTCRMCTAVNKPGAKIRKMCGAKL